MLNPSSLCSLAIVHLLGADSAAAEGRSAGHPLAVVCSAPLPATTAVPARRGGRAGRERLTP
jgi:hypothetical protein